MWTYSIKFIIKYMLWSKVIPSFANFNHFNHKNCSLKIKWKLVEATLLEKNAYVHISYKQIKIKNGSAILFSSLLNEGKVNATVFNIIKNLNRIPW